MGPDKVYAPLCISREVRELAGEVTDLDLCLYRVWSPVRRKGHPPQQGAVIVWPKGTKYDSEDARVRPGCCPIFFLKKKVAMYRRRDTSTRVSWDLNPWIPFSPLIVFNKVIVLKIISAQACNGRLNIMACIIHAPRPAEIIDYHGPSEDLTLGYWRCYPPTNSTWSASPTTYNTLILQLGTMLQACEFQFGVYSMLGYSCDIWIAKSPKQKLTLISILGRWCDG